MAEESKPDGAVSSFIDPKSKQTIWVIPRSGESDADAIERVKADHGLNPDLGTHDDLHPALSAVISNLQQNNLAAAKQAATELSSGISAKLGGEAKSNAAEEDAETKAYNRQVKAAEGANAFSQRAFRRNLPTKPEVPSQEDQFGAYFSR